MKPNVLWICTDQQRYDTLRCNGNDRIDTPNLDALAANYRHIRRHAGGPVCGVIKADGYGHGALAVADTLRAAGCAAAHLPPERRLSSFLRHLPRRQFRNRPHLLLGGGGGWQVHFLALFPQ